MIEAYGGDTGLMALLLAMADSPRHADLAYIAMQDKNRPWFPTDLLAQAREALDATREQAQREERQG